MDALCQARQLLMPGGRLVAATVYDPTIAVHAGWRASAVAEELEREGEETRLKAERQLESLDDAGSRLLEGSPARCLLELARKERATLVAVGSHGHSRAAGILLGTVATTMLHEAPCPVLLARPVPDADQFPRSIVLGVDGSPQSLSAAEVVAELVERFGSSVRALAATGGKPVDVDGLLKVRRLDPSVLVAVRSGRAGDQAARFPILEWSDQQPVDALLAASAEAELLVLGSRGLHGLSALGSVSERVAHRAACSVLVIRPTRDPWEGTA
jgi:nucleotide-binding universal stress UspA family protein